MNIIEYHLLKETQTPDILTLFSTSAFMVFQKDGEFTW